MGLRYSDCAMITRHISAWALKQRLWQLCVSAAQLSSTEGGMQQRPLLMQCQISAKIGWEYYSQWVAHQYDIPPNAQAAMVS